MERNTAPVGLHSATMMRSSRNRPSTHGISKRPFSASLQIGVEGMSIRVKVERNSGSIAVASRAELELLSHS